MVKLNGETDSHIISANFAFFPVTGKAACLRLPYLQAQVPEFRIAQFVADSLFTHVTQIPCISGVRMLDGKATDALEASSLGFQLQYVDVFSNCWGPKDDGKTFGKPGPLAAKALKRGAEAVRYRELFPV